MQTVGDVLQEFSRLQKRQREVLQAWKDSVQRARASVEEAKRSMRQVREVQEDLTQIEYLLRQLPVDDRVLDQIKELAYRVNDTIEKEASTQM